MCNKSPFDQNYFSGQRPRLEKVARLLRKYSKPSQRFLDVGCGDGSITSFLVKEFPKDLEVHGVDVSKDFVERARRKGLPFKVCDMEKDKLPYPDDFFDIVHAGELIEHIVDTDHLLDEIRRVLKIDGVLVISTPNLAHWINIILFLLDFQPRWVEVSKHNVVGTTQSVRNLTPVGHVRTFTRRALKELLKVHSFEVIEEHGSHVNCSSHVLELANDVCDLLFPRCSAIIILVAKKIKILRLTK